MKRVQAASGRWWEDPNYVNENGYDRLHPYFDFLDPYNVGYDMSGSGFDVVFTARKDRDKMPKITVSHFEEDGVIYFEPKMEFPVLDGKDLPYYDSMGYWIDRWRRAESICSSLMRYPCKLDAYEPDEE